MTISLLKEKSTQSTSSFNLSNLNNSNSNTTPIVTSGIVFIDPKVDDYEMLMAGVKPDLEVVLLDGSHNGITQITQALKRHRGLSSLHIVAHGEAGSLWLGNGLVNSNTLDQQRDDLHSWATALAPDADILLYGCKVAAGEKGQQFVQRLSQLTSADVAASKNLTGSAALGGDWELEVKIGNVETATAFGIDTLEAYSALLVSGTQNPWTGTPGGDSYTYTGSDNFTGYGLAGNDTIVGGIGNDAIYGGDGIDSLVGGDGNDYLEGEGADTLEGGAGNDTLVGNNLNGTARIYGGAGDDTYIVNSTTSILFYPLYDAAGNDTVISSAYNYSLGQGLDNLTLIGSAIFGLGNSLNNLMIGNNSDNILRGCEGNDTIYGGDGNDNLYGGGRDTGRQIIEYTDQDGNNYLDGGNGNDSLYGGFGSDTLMGSAGDDSLDGYFGNDNLMGGAGNDYLRGGSDYDYGDDNDSLDGGDGNDTLVGDFGNDILNGGLGSDSMAGGAGDDTYYVDSRYDVVTENLNEGTDTVISSQQYQLGNNLENLTLTGTASRGIGNSLNNIITGNSQANYIVGQAGNDTLYGGGGNDNLNGNDGNDYLYGGVGNDTVVGQQGNDLLSGGYGNDLLVGYGASSGEIDTLVGGGGADIFGVGVSYAHFGGGSGGLVGYTGDGNTGYALIQDWESTDKIELYGNINLYRFGVANMAGTSAVDTTISYNGPNGADLIAVIQDSTNIPSSSLIFFT